MESNEKREQKMKSYNHVTVLWRDGSKSIETVDVEYERTDNVTGFFFGSLTGDGYDAVGELVNPRLSLRIDGQPYRIVDWDAAPATADFAVDENFRLESKLTGDRIRLGLEQVTE